MKLYPSLRNLWNDLFPSIFIVVFGMMIGIAFALGRFDPTGPLQTLVAWICLVYTPVTILLLVGAVARPAVVLDGNGVRWRLINRQSGYVSRDQIVEVAAGRKAGVTMLRIKTRSDLEKSIPVQTRRGLMALEAEARSALELDER